MPHLSQDILVIDAGTSKLRAAVFDRSGRCRRQVARPVALQAQELSSEIDPDRLWQATLEAMSALETQPGEVGCIAVTAALGVVFADAAGTPLVPPITWQDRRATAEAQDIARRLGPGLLNARTGRAAAPALLGPLALWMQAHRPAVLAGARSAFSIKDWLVQGLCGGRATDPASASYTMLYDIGAGRWAADIVAELGVPPELLAPVRAATDIAGGLAAQVARRCGLLAGTPVIVGGPDGTVAGIGAGMTRPGIAIDVMGTTDVVLAYSPRPLVDERHRLVLNRFPVGDAWTLGGPMAATGGIVDWLLKLTGGSLGALAAAAGQVAAGADGIVFLPTLAGSRTPRWDPQERGALDGLSLRHGAPHIFRALLEGCAVEVAEVFDILAACGLDIAEIRGVGGGTASELWLRIRASVLNRPIILPDVTEASSLGAAMLAAVATGCHADLDAAATGMVRQGRRIEPVPEWAEAYRAVRCRHAEFRTAVGGLTVGRRGV